MPTSEHISLWRKKAEIDYIPLFISLWLSFNAWMKLEFKKDTDRELIELCKSGENALSNKFEGLMAADSKDANLFKGNIAELQRALANARILFEKEEEDEEKDKTKRIINFKDSIINWNNGKPEFESILKEEKQTNKIKIDDNLYVDKDSKRVFAAYIEITYQIRCLLFHGNLLPTLENERVIKQLYLTLSMIMEKIERV